MPPIIKEIEDKFEAEFLNKWIPAGMDAPSPDSDSRSMREHAKSYLRSSLRRVVEAQTNYLKDWAGALDPTTASSDYFEGMTDAVETLAAETERIIHSLENKQDESSI